MSSFERLNFGSGSQIVTPDTILEGRPLRYRLLHASRSEGAHLRSEQVPRRIEWRASLQTHSKSE